MSFFQTAAAENDLQKMIIEPLVVAQQEVRKQWQLLGRTVYKMADENLSKTTAAIVKKVFNAIPFAFFTAVAPWWIFIPMAGGAFMIHTGYKPFSKEVSGNMINGVTIGTALLVIRNLYSSPFVSLIYGLACFQLLQRSTLITKI
jgi:hypothetical protein